MTDSVPPIFAIPGWGMTAGSLEGLLRRLEAHRLHGTVTDLPGHGQSRPLTAPDAADWPEALLAAAPPRAVWLGWSLGASLALAGALRAPERVAGLVLIAPPLKFTAGPDWPWGVEAAWLERFAAELAVRPQRTWRRFLLLAVRDDAGGHALARALEQGAAPPDPAMLLAGLEWLRGADWRGQVRALGVPALALWGARDRLTPPPAPAALAACWPNLEVRILHGGHTPFQSEPERIAGTIADFVRQIHLAAAGG